MYYTSMWISIEKHWIHPFCVNILKQSFFCLIVLDLSLSEKVWAFQDNVMEKRHTEFVDFWDEAWQFALIMDLSAVNSCLSCFKMFKFFRFSKRFFFFPFRLLYSTLESRQFQSIFFIKKYVTDCQNSFLFLLFIY